MRVTLTISAITSGGAERVMVLLAKGLSQRGHTVTLVSLSSHSSDFYSLPPTIQRIGLNVQQKALTPLHGLWNTIRRLLLLRRVILSTHPQVVISFMDEMNILTTLALWQTKCPVIATEHCNPKIFPCRQPWETLRRVVYPHIQKLVSVSQDVDREFAWIQNNNRTVIPNPFLLIPESLSQLRYPDGVNPDKKWIITMGRLIPEKGFDLLLTAFQKIAPYYVDWQLLILGEGQLKDELETLVVQLGLSNQVVLTGAIRDPFPLLKCAEFFVMSSRSEGFPMALGEALACGLPAIAMDCSSGVREILRDGIDGILVPNQDVTALSAAMTHLMSDEVVRNNLASRAPEVIERFSLDQIMKQWETLMSEVVG